jgi:hypothetical protein
MSLVEHQKPRSASNLGLSPRRIEPAGPLRQGLLQFVVFFSRIDSERNERERTTEADFRTTKVGLSLAVLHEENHGTSTQLAKAAQAHAARGAHGEEPEDQQRHRPRPI